MNLPRCLAVSLASLVSRASHAQYVNLPGALPYDTWVGSMMGNTMSDPLVLAALTVARGKERPCDVAN